MKSKSNLKILWELFRFFFNIGFFTIGGGYVILGIMETEVTKRGWMDKADLIDIFAVAQSLPGAVAINSATFIGYRMAGKKGALFSLLGMVLPSFIVITTIAVFFSKFNENIYVKKAFGGIRAGVVAVIFLAAVKMMKTAVIDRFTLILMLLSLTATFIFDLNAIYVIIAAAAIGIIRYYIKKGNPEEDQ